MTIDDVIPRSLSDHIDNIGLIGLLTCCVGAPIMDNPIANTSNQFYNKSLLPKLYINIMR